MPRNGRPLLAHGILQRLAHARHGVEAAFAIGEGADARQHDTVGALHILGLARDGNVRIGIAFARRTLERLGRGMQIARAVVDDDDALHCPRAQVFGVNGKRQRLWRRSAMLLSGRLPPCGVSASARM